MRLWSFFFVCAPSSLWWARAELIENSNPQIIITGIFSHSILWLNWAVRRAVFSFDYRHVVYACAWMTDWRCEISINKIAHSRAREGALIIARRYTMYLVRRVKYIDFVNKKQRSSNVCLLGASFCENTVDQNPKLLARTRQSGLQFCLSCDQINANWQTQIKLRSSVLHFVFLFHSCRIK